VLDHAITSTISRTIITHGSTQIMVLSMLIFGGETLYYFSLALTIGICFGIYSSVLVASPLVMWLGVSREQFVRPKKQIEGETAVPMRMAPSSSQQVRQSPAALQIFGKLRHSSALPVHDHADDHADRSRAQSAVRTGRPADLLGADKGRPGSTREAAGEKTEQPAEHCATRRRATPAIFAAAIGAIQRFDGQQAFAARADLHPWQRFIRLPGDLRHPLFDSHQILRASWLAMPV
jgi:hypothetical protein